MPPRSSRCSPSSTPPCWSTTTAWSPTPCPRAPLRRVQTPQGFDRTTLEAAYAGLDAGADLTDDAAVVRRAGVPVATVAGDELCAKVTVAHDLAMAELVLRSADGQEAPW